MNMAAGCLFMTRNPHEAPAIAMANAPRDAAPPARHTTPKPTNAIAQSEDARPSTPSVTFTALLSATMAKAESA
jgi:hypothetical protein